MKKLRYIKSLLKKISLLVVAIIYISGNHLYAQDRTNIALKAVATTSYVSPWQSVRALNDGFTPINSTDNSNGIYCNWNSPNTLQWVEYEWPKAYKISATEIYWFDDNGGTLLPTKCDIEYWDGSAWVKTGDVGLEKDKFNTVELPDIVTNKLRVSMVNPLQSTGIVEWRVLGGPNLPAVEWAVDAYSFDSNSKTVNAPINLLKNTSDFAVSMWVKLDALEIGSRIFDFGSSARKHMYLTGKGKNNNIEFVITKKGNKKEQFISGTYNKPLPVGSWQHITVVQKGHTGILYINGEEVGRNSDLTVSPSDFDGLSSNYIGRSQNNDLSLKGQVKEFKVFGSFLSDKQIISDLITIKKASTPTPNDNWFIVSTNPSKKVEWCNGNYLTASNLYLGTSYDEVANSTVPYKSGIESTVGSVSIPDNLTEGKTYYWRVDELNGTDVRKGDVWRFKYIGPKVKVFLMGGQSNMTGFTPLSEITADLKHEYPEAMIWVDGQTTARLAKKWMNLTTGLGWSTSYFGPELGFGPEIAKDLPNENIALLKCSWGGTNIVHDWRPPSSGDATGDLYKKFIKTVHDGIAEMPEGLKPEIAGMLWMQGEYDANNTKQAADEYESNLTNLIKDLRAEFKSPNMPFIIGQISEAPAWAAFGSTIRQAQLNVSKNVPYTSMVITNDYKFTDGVHYNGKGTLSLGKRFATSMYNMLNGNYLKPESVNINNPITKKK
jgi:hypothetical protein